MLKQWMKTWKKQKMEMSLEEWQALCVRIQKELSLNFEKCS